MSNWSVVQTESRREQVAADFLKRDFEVYFPKVLNPYERAAPLFPGYLFVAIEDQWWAVRWAVGVVRVLMMNDKPAVVASELLDSLRDSEIDGLVRLPEQNQKPRARVLCCGDAVRVVTGSLAGKIGIYQGQSGSQRSRILLNLLGRQVKTTVRAVDLVRLE
jgi:transcriptional antiterminator RfaH